jgi:NADPH:quinone reductase-like Zn-dependent oxidoreductase
VAASNDLPEGTTVAAVMGEMGRQFDGGYAEYALLPSELLMPLTTKLPWDVLAALPETYLTAQGALDTLGLVPGGRLLIRGGTSSVGMAAAKIAAAIAMQTVATTRQPHKASDHVVLEEDAPDGPDYILDLVGARTVQDSLRRVRRGGTVCVAGSLSGWTVAEFEPIAMIPSGTRLTAFHSDDAKGATATLQRVVDQVETDVYRPTIDRVFGLDEIVAAHRYMEGDNATGKVVMMP